ncbi:MAG: PH domain-containing protein [Agathobacter sp.]|nr:PH domain-containing protein [Agathobacter sp.]
MADTNTNEIHVDMDTTPVFTERKRLLFFGLPWTFTKYTITPSLLTIAQGLLNTTEDDCYMYKIQDVKLNKTLLERLFGLATITCYTGDVTHKEIKLEHIKHADEIKTYLLKTSEEARIKRRTLSTIDISANADDIEETVDAF